MTRDMMAASDLASDSQREATHSLVAAVIDELHIETADGGDGFEHLRLQLRSRVPRRLPARGRVERKDQPAANWIDTREGTRRDARAWG